MSPADGIVLVGVFRINLTAGEVSPKGPSLGISRTEPATTNSGHPIFLDSRRIQVKLAVCGVLRGDQGKAASALRRRPRLLRRRFLLTQGDHYSCRNFRQAAMMRSLA